MSELVGYLKLRTKAYDFWCFGVRRNAFQEEECILYSSRILAWHVCIIFIAFPTLVRTFLLIFRLGRVRKHHLVKKQQKERDKNFRTWVLFMMVFPLAPVESHSIKNDCWGALSKERARQKEGWRMKVADGKLSPSESVMYWCRSKVIFAFFSISLYRYRGNYPIFEKSSAQCICNSLYLSLPNRIRNHYLWDKLAPYQIKELSSKWAPKVIDLYWLNIKYRFLIWKISGRGIHYLIN